MQLFILDESPQIAVECLSDIHLRKMCVETAQILSSVFFNSGWLVKKPFPKPYNPNHPIIKAINSYKKIEWVVQYNKWLHREYEYRFDKLHAYHSLCSNYEDLMNLVFAPDINNQIDIQSFCRDFKDFSSNESNIVDAYRGYYRYKKSIINRWHYTKRNEPNWLQ